MEYLKVWTNFKKILKPLNDDEIGRLFMMMLTYAETGEEPTQFIGNELFVWAIAKRDIDMAAEKAVKLRENGCKGGRPKTKENQGKPNETKENQSEPNETYENQPEPNPNLNIKKRKEIKSKVKETDILFDRFWSAYPRHEAKATARAEFDKLKPDEELLETMLASIDKQKQSAQWQENGGQYIPHPRTWLHQRRWEDEVTENRPTGKTVIAQQYSQRDYSGEDEAAMQWMIDAIKAEKEHENEGRLQVL